MAKLGSILKNVGKATKRINPGKFFKGKKEGLVKGIKGGIKGLQQSKVKGKNSLLNVKSLEPIRPDLKQGGVRKVGRLVTNKVQSLVPKIAKSVTSKVNQFDPNALLGKIFDGGLNSLNSFASGLGGLKNSLQRNLEFLKEAKGIIVDLITKMAKAKPRGGGGGFFKGLIKNIAKVGLLAMAFKAAPAAMGVAAVGGKMALGAGALVAGGMLAGKAFGAVKRRLQKKKQGADKIDGDRFNEIIEKFQSELNMIEKRKRRRKDDKPEKDEQEEVKKDETDSTTDTTESKVEPQEEVMGGSPNAILKIEEGGKMIITPTQGGEEKPDDKGGKESTTKPAAEKEKPQGLKRVAAGFMDFATGNMFDFDSRGSSVDGLKRFLKGDKGESGDKGNRGALGSQGEPGPRRSEFEAKKEMLKNKKKFGGTGNEITIGNITYVPGDKGYKDAFNSITDVTTGSGAITPLSEAKPAPSEADAKLEMSKDIAQPAIQPSGGGTGGGTILPVPIPAQDKKRTAGSTPIQRTQNATKNVVPILPAIDMSNIHIQYSRSVFNIIDAM